MIKLIKKNKYNSEVLYKDELYKLENEIIIKYQISVGKIFTSKEFEIMINDNNFYYYDRLGKNKLKRLLTIYELKNYLKEQGASPSVIKQLIDKYIKYNYLNDEYYTKHYVDFKKNKEGPKLIFSKLVEKGIDKEIINNELAKVDEEASITNYVNNKIGKFKNKTKKQISEQLKRDLTVKGFNYQISNNVVNNILNELKIDTSYLLEKEFDKILRRYSKKLENNELKYLIKQKLYQKGFNINDIDIIINKKGF